MMNNVENQDVAFGGKGVARVDGRVVFVPFTLLGETVQIEIVSERKNFAEGRLLKVTEASVARTKPPCPYFGTCGGCSYQHALYPEQLRIKQHQVSEALRRIGKISTEVQPCVPSPQTYHYRNRITVHSEGGMIGFFAVDGHHLVDIERCGIASDPVNVELAALRSRRLRDGHFTLREDAKTRTFRQTNEPVAELLAQTVGEALPDRGGLLIDAYCGSGFFLKRFRERFERMIGIEWSKFAVEQAERTQEPGESYLCGDVALHLATALQSQLPETTLLLDPPAEGVSSEVIRSILRHPPQRLLYVSCNPATLARDLGRLATSFTVSKVVPFDMFPQTAEIEVLTVLQRNEANTASRPELAQI